MLLPTTETGILILLAVSLLCSGIWASSLKAAKKWRFELFYYDFTLGVVLAALVAAFTAGSWNQQELTFQDDYLLAGYRKMAWCLGSGVVFNLGNLLLLASMAASGMSIAFPITFGVAWAVGALWEFAVSTGINGMLTVSGATAVVIAAVLTALAYAWYVEAEENKKLKALRADPRAKKASPPRRSSARGIVLAVVGGLVMSVFFPALTQGTTGGDGVAPYGAMLLVAAGIFGSTILYVPFFLYFPVEGAPLQVRDFTRGTWLQHSLGLLGGVIWTVAMLTGMVSGSSETASVSQATRYVFIHSGPALAALLGLLVWRDLPESTMRVKLMLFATLVLFLAGIGMIALAPMY